MRLVPPRRLRGRNPPPAATSLPYEPPPPFYDAWNRLVSLSGGITASYEYDGLHRRIKRVENSSTRHFYYNEQWQCLEERSSESGSATTQYTWHPHYVDALAFYYEPSSSKRFYSLYDALFNVTALVNKNLVMVERYAYDAYGKPTILEPNFSPDGNNKSDYYNEHLFTGRRTDPGTCLQLNRNRYYHQQLGRWVSRDPIGYAAGDMNLYTYVDGEPLASVDPLGLVKGTHVPDTKFRLEFDKLPNGTPRHYHVLDSNGERIRGATERIDGGSHDGMTLDESALKKKDIEKIRKFARKREAARLRQARARGARGLQGHTTRRRANRQGGSGGARSGMASTGVLGASAASGYMATYGYDKYVEAGELLKDAGSKLGACKAAKTLFAAPENDGKRVINVRESASASCYYRMSVFWEPTGPGSNHGPEGYCYAKVYKICNNGETITDLTPDTSCKICSRHKWGSSSCGVDY